MASFTLKTGVGVALAATTVLGLAACSDPGAAAAGSAGRHVVVLRRRKTFNLSPQQDRVKVTVDAAAAALVPDAIKKDGKLTVAVSPFAPPAGRLRHGQQDAGGQRGGYRRRAGRDPGPGGGHCSHGLGRLAARR